MVLIRCSPVTTMWTLAIAALPQLAFVLQTAGLGAAVGSIVALRAQWRWPSVDPWRITTTWATLGLVVGILVAVVDAAT